MRIFLLCFVLLGFLSASLFSNNELENLSTLIHLSEHQNHSHSHDDGGLHHDSHHDEATESHPHSGTFSFFHKHSSQSSDENEGEPHEHHLNLLPGFVAFVIEPNTIEPTVIDIKKPQLIEPNQLISNPHLNRLFRPPIS